MTARSIGAIETVVAALMFVAACQQDCKTRDRSVGCRCEDRPGR
jgi:hypothetical protein